VVQKGGVGRCFGQSLSGNILVTTKLISPKTLLSISGAIAVLFVLYLSSLYRYLLFHSIAELFSIIIATTIFLIAWNARRFLDNNYFIYIGVAYLFVAGLDLIHTLAYKGTGIFLGYDANLPTQLWGGPSASGPCL
jgi:hypothetical protein